MILNREYYVSLWGNFENIRLHHCILKNKAALLTLKMILACRERVVAQHYNLPVNSKTFELFCSHLYLEIANEIFLKWASFPPLFQGSKVKSKKGIRSGGSTPRQLVFEIIAIKDNTYTLYNNRNFLTWNLPYYKIVEDFIPVAQNAQSRTLNNYVNFFDEFNDGSTHDFTPTYFDRKCAFLGPKAFYEELSVKSRIPSSYLTYNKEDEEVKELKSIPALPDSMIFYSNRYEVLYKHIQSNAVKIDSIFIIGSYYDPLSQILQDSSRLGFKLIVLTNFSEYTKISQVNSWNWFVEEIQLCDTL